MRAFGSMRRVRVRKSTLRQQGMVKMHDVRLKELEKFAKGFSQIDTSCSRCQRRWS